MANTLGILGRKIGMTRIFGNDGVVIPVTIIAAGPCPVMQIKTEKKEGYEAIQLGYDEIAERKVNKPSQGHQSKAGKGFFRKLKEFRVPSVEGYELGQDLTVEIFTVGEHVKVTGRSKGKGFQGVMKRWNFAGSRASHGAEKVHRSPGSIGNATYPGKVFKGKKMPGHMGDEQVTYPNVEIVEIRLADNIIVVKGQIPGSRNSLVVIRKAS